MPAWLIPAAISGVGSLSSFLANRANRTPKFGRTPYGRYLSRVSKEGIYSPATRKKMLRNVGIEAGNVAQQTRADIRGYLTSRNMGDSIAGTRLLSQPDINTQNILANKTSEIDIANEASKTQAEQQLMQQGYAVDLQRQAESRQNVAGLVSGLAQAGAQGYRDKLAADREAYLKTYYEGRVSPKMARMFPANFHTLTPRELILLGKELGIDWRDLQEIQFLENKGRAK